MVRYVAKSDIEDLQADIEGYNRFMKLVQQYADEIIRTSRIERQKRKDIRTKIPDACRLVKS